MPLRGMQQSAAKRPATFTLSPDTLAAVRARVDRDGVYVVARELGVDRSAVTRLLAGLPVRRGTVASLTLSLARAGSTL